MKGPLIVIILYALVVNGCQDDPASGDSESPMMQEEYATIQCIDGIADSLYECRQIDLVANLTIEELEVGSVTEGQALNDIWGWTDPESGKEYALIGLTDGVVFVDLSSPDDPQVVGKLEETEAVAEKSGGLTGDFSIVHDEKSAWRDFKVYQNHLFVVSDGQPHGMQVFDLTRLREVDNTPQTFAEDYLYNGFENAHNIAINTETGFAYVVGSDTYGGGLHIIDIQNPISPQFAGFHSDSSVGRQSTGYVHDAQCVSYNGPDADYTDKEICMNSSETHLVIVDVTNKEQTKTLAKITYDNNGYAHQGWLTEDHRYFLLDDEFDEGHHNLNTQTYIFDVQDLDNPELIGVHESTENSIDHNQYVKGNYVFQANYTSGLRVLSLDDIENGELEEIAYFDNFSENDNQTFDGAWSNYPYFESGLIVVSDISNGLFILSPTFE